LISTITYFILKDKKAAKKIIKLAKEHPNWYTQEDVLYAKQVKRRIKLEKQARKQNEGRIQ
tara:strand:+ start:281 stop:463 length:183 start_codon:yes stop_codon:yes gene_type:complete